MYNCYSLKRFSSDAIYVDFIKNCKDSKNVDVLLAIYSSFKLAKQAETQVFIPHLIFQNHLMQMFMKEIKLLAVNDFVNIGSEESFFRETQKMLKNLTPQQLLNVNEYIFESFINAPNYFAALKSTVLNYCLISRILSGNKSISPILQDLKKVQGSSWAQSSNNIEALLDILGSGDLKQQVSKTKNATSSTQRNAENPSYFEHIFKDLDFKKIYYSDVQTEPKIVAQFVDNVYDKSYTLFKFSNEKENNEKSMNIFRDSLERTLYSTGGKARTTGELLQENLNIVDRKKRSLSSIGAPIGSRNASNFSIKRAFSSVPEK